MARKWKQRDREARQRVVEQWLQSGMTAREFASKHGVTASSLGRWAKETQSMRRPIAEEAEPRFIEVSAAVPAPRMESVRLTVGPVTLELQRLPPAEYVAALGRALC